ncbi:MAG: hypothetical protein ACXW3B_16385, partial [Telluria sp.]
DGFGFAYASAGYADKSIEWYQKAVCAPDGSASLRAAQQLGEAAEWAERISSLKDGCVSKTP